MQLMFFFHCISSILFFAVGWKQLKFCGTCHKSRKLKIPPVWFSSHIAEIPVQAVQAVGWSRPDWRLAWLLAASAPRLLNCCRLLPWLEQLPHPAAAEDVATPGKHSFNTKKIKKIASSGSWFLKSKKTAATCPSPLACPRW